GYELRQRGSVAGLGGQFVRSTPSGWLASDRNGSKPDRRRAGTARFRWTSPSRLGRVEHWGISIRHPSRRGERVWSSSDFPLHGGDDPNGNVVERRDNDGHDNADNNGYDNAADDRLESGELDGQSPAGYDDSFRDLTWPMDTVHPGREEFRQRAFC